MIYDFHSKPKHIFLTTPMHTVHSFFQKNRCFCFLFIYVLAVLPSFSSVQFSHSVVSDSLWAHGLQASLSITNSGSLLKLMSIESVMPSNHLILCRPLLLPPSILLNIRIFSNESLLCIRWPKYWSFSFSISPSSEYLGLISFRMDWFDLLAVQGTLNNLLQHHSLKTSVLWYSAFCMVQFSHPYMTTGKNIVWTIWTFVSKIMYLFFNNVSKLVIAFLEWINVLLYWNVSFYQY